MDLALLALAAALGGALNSVAGGGSFITLPSLIFAGVSPVVANTTSAVALWPGSVASAYAYRKDIHLPWQFFVGLATASLVGGVVGAQLLLITSNAAFLVMLPWLLLFASVLFTAGGPISAKFRGSADGRKHGVGFFVLAVGAQLVIAIYGGFFGGGMGIMMLAAFSLMGMVNIHGMNGLKMVLATLINGVAVISFIVAGAIDWRAGGAMVIGSIAGGYLGASGARKVDPKWIRRFVMLVAWAMTVYFFIDVYAR